MSNFCLLVDSVPFFVTEVKPVGSNDKKLRTCHIIMATGVRYRYVVWIIQEGSRVGELKPSTCWPLVVACRCRVGHYL